MPERPIGFHPKEIPTLVNQAIIEEHLEAASFQWDLRDHAVREPHYKLKDLAYIDEKVDANLDGLRVAGQQGLDLCLDTGFDKAGQVFTAAILLLEASKKTLLIDLLNHISEDLDLQRGFISALGWSTCNYVDELINYLSASESPIDRRIAVNAICVRRKDPYHFLYQAMSSTNAEVRACAFKAVGTLGLAELLPSILQVTSHANEACRFFAAWSAIRLGHRSSRVASLLDPFTQVDGPYTYAALNILLRCIPPEQAFLWLQKNSLIQENLRWKVIALGILGIPEQIPALIKMMEIDPVARVAGEAFAMMTGVDLEYEDLDRDDPHQQDDEDGEKDALEEKLKNHEEEDDDEASLEVDPDEELCWPNPELVSTWWKNHGGQFERGQRYLAGQKISESSLHGVLRQGFQRQRAAAALELALRQPTKPLFEVRASARQQLRLLT